MPNVGALDSLSPSVDRRDDDNEERRTSESAALDAAQKRAHGDPEAMRTIVRAQQAIRREDESRLVANDPPRPADPTSPDARTALDATLHRAVLDAGGPTIPASTPVGVPILDLAARPDMMTRQQVETQIALTREAQSSPFVMLDPTASMQLAIRMGALRQRQAELNPPMPSPTSLPDARAILNERDKQRAFIASAEGKTETPEKHAAREHYIASLGRELETRAAAWEASTEGQQAAKTKLYASLAALGDKRGCAAGDTVDSLHARREAILASKAQAKEDDEETRDTMGAHGERGTLDSLARQEQALKWNEGLEELHAIQTGPLGTAGSLAGHALGLSDETRRALANLGSIGDGFALSMGVRGQETERLQEFTFRGEQAAAGRSPPETNDVVRFFSQTFAPRQYWSATMRGFDPDSHVEILPTDLTAVRYYSDPTKARGMWLTETPVADPERELALGGDNTALDHKVWVIPAGTLVLRGICAPLNGQPGGGSQIFLPDPKMLREP
jgi:hypothetical protein